MNRATLRIWDDDACRRVHEASLTLLARTGVEMKDAGARERCAAAGAAVEGTRVRMPAELVERALESAPRSWTLRPRGGETAPLELRDGAGHTGSGPDCLYVADPVTGERRRATLADVEAAARFVEALPNIDFAMSMALPEDVANEVVDVVQFAAMLRGTRKPIVVSSPFGGETLYTMHAMAAAAGEADSFACLAMTSPPLMLDDVCCTKALACAELGVPLVLAPSVSAGAQGPASLTACVAVANAEVLAGLVVHQIARPGAPFVMGVGTGVMNMQHAVEVYNSPGVFLGNQAQLDVIRWYGLPSWHYAGHSDSKKLDEQWALELGISTVMGGLSRATLLHDVGYLESGLQSALEALVLGDEVIGLRPGPARRAARRRGGPGAGRGRGGGPGRQPSRHQDDAPALPRLLARVADRPEHARALVGGRRLHAPRARAGPRGRDPGRGPLLHARRRHAAPARRAVAG